MDNSITLIGNATRDPEMRFMANGNPSTSLGLAVNRRWRNQTTNEWEEATSFFNVVCWRDLAEHVAESVLKGARLIVTGRLEQRSWEDKEGGRHSTIEVIADDIGPSLRFATAKVEKAQRDAGPHRQNTRSDRGYNEEPF